LHYWDILIVPSSVNHFVHILREAKSELDNGGGGRLDSYLWCRG